MKKHQKLALQMWREIRKQLPEWHRQAEKQNYHGESVGHKIRVFSVRFLAVRHIYWADDNWLCDHYHSDCSKCPLKSCNAGDSFTAWYSISRGWESLQDRLHACNVIIRAIESVQDAKEIKENDRRTD